MKEWFRKKVWNFLNSDSKKVPPSIELAGPERLYSEGINICVYGATGGTVVEFRKYDRHKDQRNNKLYVISSDQDFGEQFSKIVTMEMLR